MSDNERQLLKLAKQGNVAAFEELIQPHQKGIYNLMLKTYLSEFEASHFTQEVFVKVFSSLEYYCDPVKLVIDIYKIADELCKKALCKSLKIS